MRPNDFRKIALRMDAAIEGAHMGHPDFRADGRIFATLYPDGKCGMVKLTRDQQADFMRGHPAAFVPAAGAWGVQGCTTVKLDSVDEETLGAAMTIAWQNAAARRTNRKDKTPRKRRG